MFLRCEDRFWSRRASCARTAGTKTGHVERSDLRPRRLRRGQEQVGWPAEEGSAVDPEPCDPSGVGDVRERAPGEQVEVFFGSKEFLSDTDQYSSEERVRQPVRNGQKRVKLDWKPAIWRRDKNTSTSHAPKLAQEGYLLVGRPNMLQNRA